MLHPRLTSVDGTQAAMLAQIGTYGAWADLQVMTRWGGDGASGMYEAQWTMPLPADFDHPLLRRGTLVELMDGPWRVGSPLILSEPARGTGLDDPWQFVATGIGREVEGDNSFIAFDGSGIPTSILSTAIDQAITRGLRWSGREVGAYTVAFGANPPEDIYTVGSLAGAIADKESQRWTVGQDNVFRFLDDPTTPSYQVTPGSVALGSADDNYATVVYVQYINSSTHASATVTSPASASNVEQTYGRREVLVPAPDGIGEISSAAAQSIADGILAKYKGRLAYTNGLTLTSNEILTIGGTPADLTKLLEDVAEGCMVRIHGISSDLLEFNGQTWLDIVIGEAKYTDGAQTIDLSPMGLAPRDLAAVIESVTAA